MHKTTQLDIEHLSQIVGRNSLQIGDEINPDYTHDELFGIFEFPSCVILPSSTDEISKIMAYANQKEIPVTVRGSGTGLCGGCVPVNGGILLLTTRLNKILEIDEDNLTAIVEPGVCLLNFQEEVERLGLFYAPDPGEKSATIGGNVMTNAGGMRAIKYGVTRDHVLGLEVVLSTGEVIDVGGKIGKNSSGFSLLDLFIGSEGTLGIVTKIILKLLPLPKKTATLLVPFASLEKAISTVPLILKSKVLPNAVEFMEKEIIEAAEKYLGRPFPHKSSPAYLLLRFDGNTKAELEVDCDIVANICLIAGALDVYLADTLDRQQPLWDARGAFLEALKAMSELDEVDIVVPKAEIVRLVSYTKTLQKEFGLRILSFGHAGDGNVHIYLLRDDLEEKKWHEILPQIMAKLYLKGRELEGQVSGEHGIGFLKKTYLKESLGKTQISLQQKIKEAFDPKLILNPNKIVY
ncbi:MAG: FAD-linked oxidase C-terminal domain-containing protein [Firmicutes bacterium]|nr:FAD-linked oxidase C-terminal domain-containing protein [Bacillota bacterium]MDD4263623.1 FAD-linked oxidase C-terminal domain-containing protein [Bacillota bacterium]MDD4693253.1 FAD-linked oxidase C-terminal domain-containing protein [Bacillota bacterium]